MRLNTRFVHLSVTDTTREQMEIYVRDQFADMPNQEGILLDVVNAAEVPRRDAHGPMYDTHITAKVPWLAKPLFARAVNIDFIQSLHSCCQQLKTQMTKSLKKIRQHHRKSSITRQRRVQAEHYLKRQPEYESDIGVFNVEN